MTTMNSHNPEPPDHNDDVLIGRVAANEANAIEWAQFEARAAERPVAWESLARTLRDELQMRHALDDALECADRAEIPDRAFDQPLAVITTHRRSASWSGWALAAMVALAWVGTSFFMPTIARNTLGPREGVVQEPTPMHNGETTLAAYSPEEQAYRDYVRVGTEQGRVLEELPMVMIEARLIRTGEGEPPLYEVYYVRQLLERTRVNSAFEINRDDLGRQVPVKIDFASLQTDSDL